LKLLGAVHHMPGEFARAVEYFEQALALFRELGDRRNVGVILNNLGETARLRGDGRAAIARYEEALTIAREIGDRPSQIICVNNMGGARLTLGDFSTAESDLRQAVELAGDSGHYGLPETYRFLAEALLGQDRPEEARGAALSSLALGREAENQSFIAHAWRVLGLVASRLGAPITVGGETLDARACFSESLRVFTSTGMEAARARTLRDWATHERERGDPALADAMLEEAREIFARHGVTAD
jgi:tetratricopeptide (TPR) repeat protein